jgi:hypothetical protein
MFIATLGDFAGNGNASLSCEREAGGGSCVLETNYLVLGQEERQTFLINDVREVTHYAEYREDDIGVFVGRDKWVLHRGSESDYETIHAFFFDKPKQERLDVSILPSYFVLAALGVIPIVGGLMLFGLLRGPSSIKLTIVDGTLRVSPRWYGIPLRSYRLNLDNVTEVHVAHTKQNTMVLRGAPRPAGRLQLVVNKDHRPVTKRFLFGSEVHDRAAKEIADAIGRTVTTRDV